MYEPDSGRAAPAAAVPAGGIEAEAPPPERPAGAGPRAYRPELDGLRGLSLASIILYHTGVDYFSGGYMGPEIFFAISGYLITLIILDDLDKNRFTFANFYERRVRRIFPALFFLMAVGMSIALFILPPNQMQDYSQSVVATMAFSANILFYFKSGYFAPDVDTYPLIHMWTLAVEEQFYIFFPLLVILTVRWKRSALSAVLWAVLAVSLGACILMQYGDRSANFYMAPFRAWELIAGGLLAVNEKVWRPWVLLRPWLVSGLEVAALVMIVLPVFIYDSNTPYPGWFAIPPTLGTVLIMLVSSPATLVGRFLSIKPLVGIGLVSYSGYILHQQVFAFARSYNGTSLPLWIYPPLIALTFFLSYLSWRYVETPFRNRKFLTRKTLFRLALAGTVLLIAVGLLGHWMQGFPGRYPAERVAIARTMELSPRRDCHTEGLDFRPPSQACRYFGRTTDWAVLGDSHAIELGYALAERLRPQDRGILHLSFSSCPPALGFDPNIPGCRAWINEAVATLESSRRIHNVMLVFRHALHLYGDQREHYPEAATAPPRFLTAVGPDGAREAYWQNFAALVRRLRAAGKNVYIAGPVPELPASAEYYVYHPSVPSGASVDFFLRRQGSILRRLRAIAADTGAVMIEPHRALCTGPQCASIIGGEALYYDDNHLGLPGARRVFAMEAERGRLP